MINWRIILLPFGWLFGFITFIRNVLFDLGILSSYKIPTKSIVVGNLNVGGTGKSPHILYLFELLENHKPIAIISRGYGRKTKGLLEVETSSEAINVGDEPLMFKKRLDDKVTVIVSESREIGVKEVLSTNPESLILLDDAFQHRKVKAGFNILLTDYSRPFYNDCMLPSGDLREFKSGKNRADCIVVTKCPDKLSEEEKSQILDCINFKNEHVFFSKMIYGDLVSFGKNQQVIENVLLITGIANPKPLEEWLNRFYHVESVTFPDHHNFSLSDIAGIQGKFDSFVNKNSVIITTEKDFVRLESLLSEKDRLTYPWYYQSIKVSIEKENKFKAIINKYVDTI